MEGHTLHPEDAQRIRDYLELSSEETLSMDPVEVLAKYAEALPRSLLEPFTSITTPRDRARVRAIKSRRIMYTQSNPTPELLSAQSGRLRWPLLWERMGGSSLPPTSLPLNGGVSEEERWVRDQFQGGVKDEQDGGEVRQHVKKLGGLLRGFEEEREMESMRERKRMERRLDDVGEEFDSESDEEDGVGGRIGNARIGVPGVTEDEDQESVARAFEKKLLELFVDGLDSVPYDEIDFTEPANGDPIAARDEQDRYFDDEDPSRTPNGHDQGWADKLALDENVADELEKQNGKGQYDY